MSDWERAKDRKAVENDKLIKIWKTFTLKINYAAHALAASHTSTYPWNQEPRMNKPNRLGKLFPPVTCLLSSNPHWTAFISMVSVNRSKCELLCCVVLYCLFCSERSDILLSSFSQVTFKILLCLISVQSVCQCSQADFN